MSNLEKLEVIDDGSGDKVTFSVSDEGFIIGPDGGCPACCPCSVRLTTKQTKNLHRLLTSSLGPVGEAADLRDELFLLKKWMTDHGLVVPQFEAEE